ncbi:relaxase/mobilization nuclease domain-containing protein [Alistipes ihumii]|uniref:relaxase/mobilization nuclease domain-containing protein n=1 Tax=Alistipes ihumii TaxID=1470347 RepID=UPI003AB4D1FE
MVARITFGKNIAGVLLYNKLKVDARQAEALLCHNLPVTPTDGKIDAYKLTEAFRPWLEHPRAGLSKPVFHVSLNPHPDDRLDDFQLLEIAHRYMEEMGYGDQPYVVFRHRDIDREHLHIVSSRIQPDGRAVDYYRYKERSVKATQRIEREFGLHPAVEGMQQPFEELRRVVYARGNLKAQINSVLWNLADRYRVGSPGEWNALLGLFGISAQECTGEIDGRPYAGMIYCALDERDRKVGKPVKASLLSAPVGYSQMQREYARTKKWVRENRERLEPAREAIREAMNRARSAEEFARLIRPAGLSVVFRRSEEHGGRIYGATFIDHNEDLVINASKLDRAFSANRFHELFDAAEDERQTETTTPEKTQRIAPEPLPEYAPRHELEERLWVPNLFSELLDEAARSDYDPDEWAAMQALLRKKRKKRRRPK